MHTVLLVACRIMLFIISMLLPVLFLASLIEFFSGSDSTFLIDSFGLPKVCILYCFLRQSLNALWCPLKCRGIIQKRDQRVIILNLMEAVVKHFSSSCMLQWSVGHSVGYLSFTFSNVFPAGLFGQHNSKKPKIIKHSVDNTFDNITPMSGSIPSPVASQMSNMSNPNKIIRMIGVRDRGRKAKGLKVLTWPTWPYALNLFPFFMAYLLLNINFTT